MKYIKTYEENNIQPKIEYHTNGQKHLDLYSLNDKFHREDGPAVQSWFDNGQQKSIVYYLNDEYHREDGPAIQGWRYNGEKVSELYFLNGVQFTKEEWLQKLKEINSPHYQDQLLKHNSEKYNI